MKQTLASTSANFPLTRCQTTRCLGFLSLESVLRTWSHLSQKGHHSGSCTTITAHNDNRWAHKTTALPRELRMKLVSGHSYWFLSFRFFVFLLYSNPLRNCLSIYSNFFLLRAFNAPFPSSGKYRFKPAICSLPWSIFLYASLV